MRSEWFGSGCFLTHKFEDVAPGPKVVTDGPGQVCCVHAEDSSEEGERELLCISMYEPAGRYHGL